MSILCIAPTLTNAKEKRSPPPPNSPGKSSECKYMLQFPSHVGVRTECSPPSRHQSAQTSSAHPCTTSFTSKGLNPAAMPNVQPDLRAGGVPHRYFHTTTTHARLQEAVSKHPRPHQSSSITNPSTFTALRPAKRFRGRGAK
jgi:hypothetical protein